MKGVANGVEHRPDPAQTAPHQAGPKRAANLTLTRTELLLRERVHGAKDRQTPRELVWEDERATLADRAARLIGRIEDQLDAAAGPSGPVESMSSRIRSAVRRKPSLTISHGVACFTSHERMLLW